MKNNVIVDSLSRKWKQRMKRLSSKKDRQKSKSVISEGLYRAEEAKAES